MPLQLPKALLGATQRGVGGLLGSHDFDVTGFGPLRSPSWLACTQLRDGQGCLATQFASSGSPSDPPAPPQTLLSLAPILEILILGVESLLSQLGLESHVGLLEGVEQAT